MRPPNVEKIVMVCNNCSLGVPSKSTWKSIYRVVRVNHYNADNAPIQLLCPKTRRSQGHYGLSLFTMISMPDQLQPDVYLLVRWLCLGRASVARDLHSDLLGMRLDGAFVVQWGHLFLQNERIYKLLCHWRRSNA
jgi:hypothetical protein